MIIVHVTYELYPEKEQGFLDTMKPMVEATLKEDGCIRYDLAKASFIPHTYLLTEAWESMEALQAHFNTEHMKVMQEASEKGQFTVKPFEVQVFSAEVAELNL